MADAPLDVLEALDDLARHLPEPDPGIDVVAAALATIDAPHRARKVGVRWGRWVAAAAVIVVILGVSVPVTREAVADLLGIGGVRVRLTGGVPGGLDATLDLGEEVELDVAADRAAQPLLAPEGIGSPAAAFAGRPPGGVTLVWAPSEELPEVLDTGVGLLLTVFPAELDVALVEKRALAGSRVEQTTVGGAPALWIAGAPHSFLYVDPDGRAVEDTARLSANALVWERDGVTHRLESSLPLVEARRLADSLERLDP